MGFFKKISDGLKKTRENIGSQFDNLAKSFSRIDEEMLEELEEILIMSDCGVETSLQICEEVRRRAKAEKAYNSQELNELIGSVISDMMTPQEPMKLNTKPSIILVIGVNGVGKTTTIGKLAAKYTREGKKVLLAAADTFRAAAIDQLEVWAQRSQVQMISHAPGSDPAAVVFDSISAAKAREVDILICDTAGRLHNKKNLMDELSKINRIIEKEAQGADVEKLLVLDATTGQNALLQAKQFKEVADITGMVLTKLDGTAKGGVVIAIKNEMDVPVRFVGVGEQIDDLEEFDSQQYARALFYKEDNTQDEIEN